MKTWKRVGLLTVAAAGVVSLASSLARAGTLTPVDVPLGDTVTGYLDNSELGTTTAPGLSSSVVLNNDTGSPLYYAGEIYWDQAYDTDQVIGTPTKEGSFITFCTQLNNDVDVNNTYTYTVTNLASILDVSLNSRASAVVAMIEDAEYYALSDLNSANSSTGNNAAAGLQIAIWKLIYGYNGTSASLAYNSSVTATSPNTEIMWDNTTSYGMYATSFLSQAYAQYNSGGAALATLDGLNSSTGIQNQSILVSLGSGSPAPTPAPKPVEAGLVLFGAIGAFAGFRRFYKTPAVVPAPSVPRNLGHGS